MGIINLSENESEIREITYNRPIASIPMCGRYRVIDFILSNMVNSGLENVLIFTQGKSRSLINHVRTGKEWDLDRKNDGLFVLDPVVNAPNPIVGEGDMQNFRDYMDYIKRSKQEYVILAKSYMICNIDFNKVFEFHQKTNADITIVYKRVKENNDRFLNCDTLNIDEHSRIISVGKKVKKEENCDVSMDMFLMKKSLLLEQIENSVLMGNRRFIKEAIMLNIDKLNINGYRYDGYLSCINSIKNYYITNMELLDTDKYNQLFYDNGLVYTRVMDEPPTKYTDNVRVINSLIANGCEIEGTIENSVIGRGVKIKKGAVIKNSVVMQRCVIEEGTYLKNAILDKNVHLTANKILHGDEASPIVIRKNMEL
jgi:glucose-1-phosphate adenylyltransferase